MNNEQKINYLVDCKGYTEEEADKELDTIMAEQYMLQNPDIAGFMGWKVAKEAGMLDEFTQYQQQRQKAEKGGQFPIGRQIGSQGGQPREQNIQAEVGMQQPEVAGVSPTRRPAL